MKAEMAGNFPPPFPDVVWRRGEGVVGPEGEGEARGQLERRIACRRE